METSKISDLQTTEYEQHRNQYQTEIQENQEQKCESKHERGCHTKRQHMAAALKYLAAFVYNNTFINVIVYFIFCNIAHHYASKLYIYLCAYSTPLFQLDSILMSPVIIISPHCMALRWLILESSNTVYFQILSCCSLIIARLSK